MGTRKVLSEAVPRGEEGVAQDVRRHGQLQLLHLGPDGSDFADQLAW